MPRFARKLHAFSLVESAIVMIIVGILISAALQATSMIRSFKLMGARAQTKSSAINSIPGIVAWYDTTSERALLKKEAVDGKQISVWNDSNSQEVLGNNATQSGTNKPTYVFDPAVANGLPILRFKGKEYFNLPDGTVPTGDYDYTFFFVMRVPSVSESYGVLGSGDYITTNSSNMVNYRAGGFVENNWQNNSLLTQEISVSAGKMQIFTFSYKNSLGRKIYVNGAFKGQDDALNHAGLPSNNTLGKSNVAAIGELYFKGDIAEVILFGRILTKEERQAVEKYLAKKWTITL